MLRVVVVISSLILLCACVHDIQGLLLGSFKV